MKFCDKCGNYYFISIDYLDENNLIYFCRNCKQTDVGNVIGDSVVAKIETTDGEQLYNYAINEYTKLDPTLPRLYNKECINPECPTNAAGRGDSRPPAEIIYMRYNNAALKYVYLCTTCDACWKQE